MVTDDFSIREVYVFFITPLLHCPLTTVIFGQRDLNTVQYRWSPELAYNLEDDDGQEVAIGP